MAVTSFSLNLNVLIIFAKDNQKRSKKKILSISNKVSKIKAVEHENEQATFLHTMVCYFPCKYICHSEINLLNFSLTHSIFTWAILFGDYH